jgi:hypothetical protein
MKLSSTVFSVSNWSIPSGGQTHADVIDSAITQSVIDSGLVMVYLDVDGFWAALPYTKYFSDHMIVTSFEVSLNTVRIIVSESDLTNPPLDLLSIKVVAIDGT